ncbi:MAG TPA: gamma-glutamyltransferase [Bacteroidales bacterium]|nr:gamma-glutamyltransferase [Bacteroidales bacterium]
MRSLGIAILLIVAAFYQPGARNVHNETGNSGITVRQGMVVSAMKQASGAGLSILKKGGNAIDAAVATGFALSVCYPEAGNIGGGGFMLIRMADGRTEVLDYREKAPLASRRDMYLDASGNVVQDLSTSTSLASGVPGSVAGLLEAHRKYGSLPFREVIQPAIDLAEKGFPLTAWQAESFNRGREDFTTRNRVRPRFVSRNPWKEGDTLRQPELGATLMLIRDKGRDGFYDGSVAGMIVRQMQRGNGIITADDLKAYRPVWRAPVSGHFHGYTILTVPPPSGGGITLLQVLKMAEDNGIDKTSFHSVQSIHLIVECERRAFADRSFFAGDADFVKVPVETLLAAGYLDGRMKDYSPGSASLSDEISHGEPEAPQHEETTHYSVTDKYGNAVSTTTTLNGTFGNCIVVEGAGFLLNNEMDDFSVKPGVPNMYGLIGGEANAIYPGKRILSSMTPSIVTKDEKLVMVTGSPGGSTIPTTVMQVILNVVLYGMNIRDAVNAPRYHHQWLPDLIYVEDNALDGETKKRLEEMGHKFMKRGPIGSANSIMRLSDGNYMSGEDKRGNNVAAGY